MASRRRARRRPAREGGQALIEAVLFSLIVAMISCCALDLGLYVYAASAADSACTEVVRACQADFSASASDLQQAAQKAAGSAGTASASVERGAAQTTSYTHHLPDGDGGWTNRSSKVTEVPCKATVTVTREPLTVLGKAIGLISGSGGSYTLTSAHSFTVDRTAESGTW